MARLILFLALSLPLSFAIAQDGKPSLPEPYPLSTAGILPKNFIEEWERPPETTDKTSAQLLALARKAMGFDEGTEPLILHRVGTVTETRRTFAIEEWTAPDRRRWELSFRHLGRDYRDVIAGNADAVNQWQAEPTLEFPESIGPPRSVVFFSMADPLALLADYETLGHQFVYRGPQTIRGRETYLIYGKLADGRLVWVNIDAKTYLPTRWSAKRVFGASAYQEDHYIVRFERVNGRLVDAHWQSVGNGRIFREVEWERIEAVKAHSDSLFVSPEFKETWVRQAQR